MTECIDKKIIYKNSKKVKYFQIHRRLDELEFHINMTYINSMHTI